MKTICRILKLLPPAFLIRLWLDKHYGIKVRPTPGGAVVGFVLAVLPYAFTAALNVRVDSDCRLRKYYLPYGTMSKFVRMAYGIQRANVARDRGLLGAVRAIMPYGLVIWWDAEDVRITRGELGRKKSEDEVLSSACGTIRDVSEDERKLFQRLDRIEVLALRCLILTGGKGR